MEPEIDEMINTEEGWRDERIVIGKWEEIMRPLAVMDCFIGFFYPGPHHHSLGQMWKQKEVATPPVNINHNI
jgi:hypothetical protein